MLVPIGMMLKLWRWRRAHGAAAPLPRVDLNDPHTRRSVLCVRRVTVFIILPVPGIAAITLRVHRVDHVLRPHLPHRSCSPSRRPHALGPRPRHLRRVPHRPGASWFVKSKITGVAAGASAVALQNPTPSRFRGHANLLPGPRDVRSSATGRRQFFGAMAPAGSHFGHG